MWAQGKKHLPHEAWHVVQQAQGRVKPTMQMKDGVPVNDDQALEHEVDVMGAKAIQLVSTQAAQFSSRTSPTRRIRCGHRCWLAHSLPRPC